MKLIDADAFRMILREIQTDAKHFHNTQRRYDIGAVIALLDEQPTAYNVEKVVEELEEQATDTEVFGKLLYLQEAIDIVKRGGVE